MADLYDTALAFAGAGWPGSQLMLLQVLRGLGEVLHDQREMRLLLVRGLPNDAFLTHVIRQCAVATGDAQIVDFVCGLPATIAVILSSKLHVYVSLSCVLRSTGTSTNWVNRCP